MFYCAKYGLPHLVESGGVLINTACTATARRCHALAAAICQHSLLSPSRIDNPPKCVAVGCCRYIVLPFIIFHQFNALRARVPTILMLPVQSVKVAFIEQGGDAGHITTQELLLPVSLHYNTTQAMPLNNTGYTTQHCTSQATLHNTTHRRLRSGWSERTSRRRTARARAASSTSRGPPLVPRVMSQSLGRLW